MICINLPLADGVFFRVETSVATAFRTNAISVIRGLNKHKNFCRVLKSPKQWGGHVHVLLYFNDDSVDGVSA